MIHFKQKPDKEFYFLIAGLILTIYVALFHVKMLCIQDYTLEIYTERGVKQIDKIMNGTKECYPVWTYFREVRERQEKQKLEAIALYTNHRYGLIDYNSSLPSFNSSSE